METVESTDAIDANAQGYMFSPWKAYATYVAVLFSGFTLALLFHWRPHLYVKLTHATVSLDEAEVIIFPDAFGHTTLSRVYIQISPEHSIKFSNGRRHVCTNSVSNFDGDNTAASPRFFYHKSLKFIWNETKKTYSLLRGLENVGCAQLLKRQPLAEVISLEIRMYYGFNSIDVPLTPIIVKIFREVLSPFYIFQCFSIILWLSSAYYLFATIILTFSIISICLTVYSCRLNENQLRHKVRIADRTLILRCNTSEARSYNTTLLVPGDLIAIPLNGCEVTADILLLNGDCIVNESALTGESIPVSKSCFSLTSQAETLDFSRHARHILFSGTTVLQAKLLSGDTQHDYVKALVLRTGFLTTKGRLVQSILYPKPLDHNFTKDAFRFLSAMAVIAFAGSVYTLVVLAKQQFDTSVLVRRSLDILTIVVPPALPAIMTTGLFLSQLRLRKQGIFCINSSAINIAGTLDTIVFDKTGTLTEEDMTVKGVWIPQNSHLSSSPLRNSTEHVCSLSGFESEGLLSCLEAMADSPALTGVLAACHSLASIPPHLLSVDAAADTTSDLIGDPLDKIVFSSTGWLLREPDTYEISQNSKYPLKSIVEASTHQVTDGISLTKIGMVQLFPFASEYQRQTVVTKLYWNLNVAWLGEKNNYAVFCKGSMDAVSRLCNSSSVTDEVVEAERMLTEKGYRVLALAWKSMDDVYSGADLLSDWPPSSEAMGVPAAPLSRDEIETELTFIGLLVLNNSVKPASAPTIGELKDSKFRIIMATGDDMRTGLSVARSCGMIDASDEVFIISPTAFTSVPTTPNDSQAAGDIPNANMQITQLKVELASQTMNLEEVGTWSPHQVTGFVSNSNQALRRFDRLLRGHETVYTFNAEGTCNIEPSDMGDSKIAHHLVMTGQTFNLIKQTMPQLMPVVTRYGMVFARFLPEDKTALIETLQSSGCRVCMCGDGVNDCGALKAAHVGIALTDCEASVAAPLTSRTQDIACTAALIKEGRCSLSSAIGSFKYITLYSFIQFSSVLMLYSIGNAFTDPEFLVIDLFIVTPLSITMAASKPWNCLHADVPPLRLLTPSNLASVLGQLSLALASQVFAFTLVRCQSWYKPFDMTPGHLDRAGSYEASGIFYFSSFQYIVTCVVVSQGPPFRQRFYKNVAFCLNLLAVCAMSIGMLFWQLPGLVAWFKLLPLYNTKFSSTSFHPFSFILLGLVCIYMACACLLEHVITMIAKRKCVSCCAQYPRGTSYSPIPTDQ